MCYAKSKILLAKNCFKLLLLMFCAIVGVGFVSGAEIFEFYVKFQNFFIVGIFVFFVLIFFLARKILLENCFNENLFKMHNCNQIAIKNTNLTKNQLKDFLCFCCYLLVSSAMISGLKLLLKNLFFNNYIFVFLTCFIIVFFIVFLGVKSLSKLDYFVFLFIAFLFVFFIKKMLSSGVDCSENFFANEDFKIGNLFGSVAFAVMYVFMNILQIKPVLIEMNLKFSKKQCNVLAFIFSLTLSLVLLVFCCFLKSNAELSNFEMPFLEYFSRKGTPLKLIFSVGLIFALISSLIGSLIGVKRGLSKKINSKMLASLLSVLLAYCLSFFGFKFFVSVIYPIIGIINFVIFVFL
jgi:uncharacterized membrane protein YkvI